MKYVRLNDFINGSVIALGCMRMSQHTVAEASTIISTAVSNGINLFDHADIYGSTLGESETVFGEALKQSEISRDSVIIQSKCGILESRDQYDFSYDHIINSVKDSLKRLKVDYLDIFLLHRPDPLAEMEEVTRAVNELFEHGYIKSLGVSNHNPMQLDLLKKHIKADFIINQLQFSLAHAAMISHGVNVNLMNDDAVMRDGSILDYMKYNDMTLQAWSPFQYGMFKGSYIGSEKYQNLNDALNLMSKELGVTPTMLAAAWINRYPMKTQVIAGTMNPARITEIAKSSEIDLTRDQWYELYRQAGYIIP